MTEKLAVATMTSKDISGKKGGGKGGGGYSEAPNTLRSNATARIVDLLSEGPILGIVGSLKGVFFDNTPIQNDDDSFNFEGVQITQRYGTPDQEYIPGFPEVEGEVSVGAEITKVMPASRTIIDPTVNYARVTIGVGALFRSNDSGEVKGTTVELKIEYKTAVGDWVTAHDVVIDGKTTSPYQRAYRVDLPEGGHPWTIRVSRVTDDAENMQVSDKTYFYSYTEVVDAKLNYADSAVVGIGVAADKNGGTIRSRTYRVRGIISRVPSNYDPITRQYTGFWDGSFKMAWHSNPAWVFYDIATNKRYGLGDFIADGAVDKFGLYTIGKYCDELVPDGYGGMEPRFTFNGVIKNREDAAKVLDAVASVFRGMVYWGSGAVVATQDAPQAPSRLVTAANVVDGNFEYTGAPLRTRSSSVAVTWNDPLDLGKQSVLIVQKDDLIRRFGDRKKEITAIGCTSRGQARRIAEWTLFTEAYESEVLTYRASMDHADVRPGEVIAVADEHYAGARFGGRVIAMPTSSTVELDAPVTFEAGGTYSISFALPSGVVDTFDLVVEAGPTSTVTLETPATYSVAPGTIWVITAPDVEPRLFRVVSNYEKEPNLYEITAVLHTPGKFDFIERDVPFEDAYYSKIPSGPLPAPTLLSAIPYKRSDLGSEAKISLLTGWRGVTDPRVSGYTVWIKEPETAEYIAYDGVESSADIATRTNARGEYTIRVRTKGITAQPSPDAILQIDSEVAFVAPEVPTGWTGVPAMFSVSLSGDQHPAVDFKEFVVYASDTEDGTYAEVARVATPRATVAANESKWYKITAIDYSGDESLASDPIQVAINRPEVGDLGEDLEGTINDVVAGQAQIVSDFQTLNDEVTTAIDAVYVDVGLANSAASAAVVAQSLAETAQAAAQAASTLAETAQEAADTARQEAEDAQAAAETALAGAVDQAASASTSATTATTQAGNASTSASQAATSASNAAGSANSASTSATNAANSSTSAGNSATAASGSASTAASHATDAGTAATAASTSATNAATQAGNASTSASQAATSASNAAGSSNSAATSATTAATSRLGALSNASGNLLSKNDFEDNNPGLFTAAVGTIPAEFPHPLGRVRALQQTNRDVYDGFDRPINFTGVRTIRITGYVLNLSHVEACVGVNTKTLTSVSSWPTTPVAAANSGVWEAFSHERVIDASGLKSWRPFFQINGYPAGGAMLTYWTDLRYEDITESKAAATSATTAATSASAAGTSASAANTSATNAATQAGNAATSATQAATSETNALGSANSAATSASVASESRQIAVDAVNTAPSLPSTFQNGLINWTTNRAGSPTAPGAHWHITHVADDPDFGDCVEFSPFSAGQNVLTLGLLPTDGKTYRLNIRFKVVSISGSSDIDFTTVAALNTVDYVNDTNGFGPLVAYPVGIHTISQVVAKTAGPGVDYAYSALDSRPLVRFGLRLSENRGAVIRIASIQVVDITSEIAATTAASAASTSASTAATHASNAGTSASAANTSATNAATQAGNASTSASQASTSATNAAGSATNAATSATTAASTQLAVDRTAAALFPTDFEEEGRFWTHSISGTPTARIGTGLLTGTFTTEAGEGRCLNVTAPQSNNAHVSPKGYISAVAGRRYRVTVRARHVGAFAGTSATNSCRLYIRRITSAYTGGSDIATVTPVFAAPNTWYNFTAEVLYAGGDPYLLPFFFTTNGLNVAGPVIQISKIIIEDITNVVAAENSATAAATSASNAAASQSAAGVSASAANTSATNAATQAANASTSSISASNSATSAAGSSAQALEYRNAAARMTSGGVSKNPIFNDWTGTYPNNLQVFLLGTATTAKVTTGNRYVNAIDLIANDATEARPILRLDTVTHALDCVLSPEKMLVRAEIELVSGTLAGGAMLASSWTSEGGNNAYSTVRLDTMMTEVTGRVQTVEWYVERPASYIEGTNPRCFVDVYARTNAGGTNLCTLRVHRFDFEVVTQNSFADIIQQAKVDVDNITSAAVALRAVAGSGGASLELVALDDPTNGPVSTARISGDNILLDGSVNAAKLSVGTGKNLAPDASFAQGLTYYTLQEEAGVGAETTMQIRAAGSTFAGPTYPTLYVHQVGTATDGSADIYHVTATGDGLTKDIRMTPVTGESWYYASVYASTHRCNGQLVLVFRNSAGDYISEASEVFGLDVAGSNNNPELWPRYSVKAQAPSGAAYAQLVYRKFGTTAGQVDSYLFVYKPQLEETHAQATSPSPWSVGGTTFIDGATIKTGSLTADAVDTGTFSAAGLAVFGDELQSSDFVTGEAGWRIQNSGDVEFNNLVVRSDMIQDGAVSREGRIYSQYGPTLVPGTNYVSEFSIAEFNRAPYIYKGGIVNPNNLLNPVSIEFEFTVLIHGPVKGQFTVALTSREIGATSWINVLTTTLDFSPDKTVISKRLFDRQALIPENQREYAVRYITYQQNPAVHILETSVVLRQLRK